MYMYKHTFKIVSLYRRGPNKNGAHVLNSKWQLTTHNVQGININMNMYANMNTDSKMKMNMNAKMNVSMKTIIKMSMSMNMNKNIKMTIDYT